jgi:murein DD-endopeptidase MepM/ murein hydrolase activator NlpD
MLVASRLVYVLYLLGVFCASAVAEEAFELSLPLACEPGKTCFIQSYLDSDPGPGVRDYACGGATYDKHDGVDFRLLSAKAAKDGVAVLAAAPGTVKATRDAMEDAFYRQLTPGQIKGKECGNGVVVDHGDGWETQYCHMLKGSITVANGQKVERGATLGKVGFSGMADFAHVHLTVRHNGKPVDPFAPDAQPGTCVAGGGSKTLWQPSVSAHLGYRNGIIIGSGFTSAPPDLNRLEADHTAVAPLNALSPALIFYARFINLLGGDRIRFVITGPGGPLIEQLSEPIERNKASYFSYAGKKRRELPWQQGRYEARAELVRDGAVAAATVKTIDLAPAAAPSSEPAP